MKIGKKIIITLLAFALAIIPGAIIATMDDNTITAEAASSIPKPKISDAYNGSRYYDNVFMELSASSISSYNILVYRSTSKNGSYKLIDTIKAGTTTGVNKKCNYNDYGDGENAGSLEISGNTANKKYYYKVALSDASGNKGSYSNILSYKINFYAVELTKCYRASSTSVKLAWDSYEYNEYWYADGYQIYRKTSGGKWKKLKTIKKTSQTTYTDKSVKSGKTYKYKIRAYVKKNSKTITGAFSTVGVAKAKTTVSGHYKSGTAYGNITSQSKRNKVRRVVQGFKDTFITKNMTKVEKLEAAYNYIYANCTYNTTAKNRQSAYGALVEGKANCNGIANAMLALCDSIGVDCRFIKSNSKSRVDHRWNEVKVGKKWYILDATCGFFLVGSKTYKNDGWAWTAKNYPTVSKKDYKKGYCGHKAYSYYQGW